MSEQVDMQNERNEQEGFVMDIEAVIENVDRENISFKEKFKKLITMRFGIEQVSNVNDYTEKATNGAAKCSDELYNIAILNEQIVDENADDDLKEEFEKRHNELVEALMNRMEGVFKMYEENLNVQPENPTVELPSDVQTPQIEEYNPVAPQIGEYTAPDMPVSNEETVAALTEPEYGLNVIPEAVAPVDYIEPTNVEQEVVENTSEEPVVELSVIDTMNGEDSGEISAEVEEELPQFDQVSEFNIPEASEAEEEAALNDADEFKVGESFGFDAWPEHTVAEEQETQEATVSEPVQEEAPVAETEEDEVVREIRERYQKLGELEIRVHQNELRLAELQQQISEVQASIDNDQDKIRELKNLR